MRVGAPECHGGHKARKGTGKCDEEGTRVGREKDVGAEVKVHGFKRSRFEGEEEKGEHD